MTPAQQREYDYIRLEREGMTPTGKPDDYQKQLAEFEAMAWLARESKKEPKGDA